MKDWLPLQMSSEPASFSRELLWSAALVAAFVAAPQSKAATNAALQRSSRLNGRTTLPSLPDRPFPQNRSKAQDRSSRYLILRLGNWLGAKSDSCGVQRMRYGAVAYGLSFCLILAAAARAQPEVQPPLLSRP